MTEIQRVERVYMLSRKQGAFEEGVWSNDPSNWAVSRAMKWSTDLFNGVSSSVAASVPKKMLKSTTQRVSKAESRVTTSSHDDPISPMQGIVEMGRFEVLLYFLFIGAILTLLIIWSI